MNVLLGLLRAFPGYTLSTLLDEDVDLLRMVQVAAMGRREEVSDAGQ